jgi:two-component system, chemotaxis family, protein-glutamate methylesterase/glutaminase
MYVLPPDLRRDGTERVTGATCPDCFGSLEVRMEGDIRLLFKCRIGHSFSMNGLLAAKEDLIEERLWTVVTSFEEFVALLEDLGRRRAELHLDGTVHGLPDRIQRARDAVEMLRGLIEKNRRLTFDREVEGLDEGLRA